MKTTSFLSNLLILVCSCFLLFHNVKAANTDTTHVNKSISLSYWGTLNNNPGIKLGLEKSKILSGKYSVLSSFSLLLNRKPNIYTSAGIVLNSSLRKTGKSGLYFEHGINVGYLGSYYDFDFYRTNSKNEIVNMGRKWINTIILGYSFGLGYDFAVKTNTNIQVYIKPGIYYRAPNNDNIFYLNNYSIEMGIALHPSWLNKGN